MQNYTSSTENFNLVQITERPLLSKRDIGIFDMVLNRLGLPDHLHEFVRAVFVAGNWDRVEWDEISLMRMARGLTATAQDQERVFNRLKKNSPKFFKWQDNQPITIIERVVLRDHRVTTHHKAQSKFRFPLYDIICSLFTLPRKMTQAAIRKAVEDALKHFPVIEKPKRGTRKKKVESAARAGMAAIAEVEALTGSMEAAVLYFKDADLEFGKLDVFAKLVLQIKDLQLKSGEPFPRLSPETCEENDPYSPQETYPTSY